MLNIGIDVGKSRCVACIKDDDGGVLKECIFTNDDMGDQGFYSKRWGR